MQQRHNWVTRFTVYFLDNKQLSWLLLLFIVGGGLLGFINIRREGFPQVPVKIIVVTTVYRGAGSAEIERSVTAPIEAAIKDVKAVKEFSSTSSDSVSSVRVTLDESANLDSATQDITSKVSKLTLPKDSDKSSVFVPQTGNSAWTFGLSGQLTQEQLLEQGRIFEREIGQVKGIKSVKLLSSAVQKVRITFDPAKLAQLGIDPTSVQTAITGNNANVPAGSLVFGDTATGSLVVGAYSSVSDLAATPLRTATGSLARLSDVATVATFVDQSDRINRIGYRVDGRLAGRTGLVYSVDIRNDADILKVNTDLDAATTRLHDTGILDSRLDLVRLTDQAKETNRQIAEIQSGAIGELWHGIGPLGVVGLLLGGIWLLILAMLLFVNLRAAIIAGVAIPLTFLFTVLSLWVFGVTLNTLTLFSMILVLGLVVDPAIVVLEAIQREIDGGLRGRAAVVAAMDSIGPGVFMAVITSIVVFIPFGVVGGVFGQIIKFIPITVLPALVASFIVPVIFLTALGGRFLKPERGTHQTLDEEENLWRVSRWFHRTNRRILRHMSIQVIIILVTAVLPLAVAGYFLGTGRVKSVQFSKPNDTLIGLASVSYPISYSPTKVDQLAAQAEAAVAKYPEISSYYYFSQGSGSFSLYLNFKPRTDRIRTSEAVIASLRGDLPQNGQDIFASADSLGVGPPVPAFPIQLQIFDANGDKLQKFAQAVGEHARSLPGVTRVVDGTGASAVQQISITLNEAAVANAGLSTLAVAGQLGGLLGDQKLTQIQVGDSRLDVVASYPASARPAAPSAIADIRLASPRGPVRLGTIATVTDGSAAGAIQRLNGNRYTQVQVAVAADGDAIKTEKDLNDWAKERLGQYGLREDALEAKGEQNDIVTSFGQLFLALGLSLVLTYFIFVLFFKSWLQPIMITFAVPLGFIGVFPALWLVKSQFGFLEILGMITLVSIVENVGTFVIDYANRKQTSGVDKKEAISIATAVRFRPIFLTKVTALGALLPLAILSPFWRGLSSVIIAGILTSGVLSLFTTPILYSWLDWWGKAPRRARNFFRRQPSLDV